MASITNRTKIRIAAAPSDHVRSSGAASRNLIALKLCTGIIVLALLPQYVAARDNTAYPQLASAQAWSAPQGAPAPSATQVQIEVARSHHRADFGAERASRTARRIANWIVDSADNQGLPFIIVDKVDARIFVFNAGGRIQGAAPALLGAWRGDHTVPGIGDREYADMPLETRTTHAGRFVAALGMDTRGEDVLWVDYDAAVSLHRVVTAKPEERRLERLATATPLDNRISYGCINVPKRFYEKVVSPAFTGTDGIVYVLPETRPAHEVFSSYDVEERWARADAGGKPASK